jgi:hypothetical protein
VDRRSPGRFEHLEERWRCIALSTTTMKSESKSSDHLTFLGQGSETHGNFVGSLAQSCEKIKPVSATHNRKL